VCNAQQDSGDLGSVAISPLVLALTTDLAAARMGGDGASVMGTSGAHNPTLTA